MKFKYILMYLSLALLVVFGYWAIVDRNQPKPLTIVSVDFDQAYFDAKSVNLKLDAGQWVSKKVEAICKVKRCLILQGGTILGGNVVDANALFRQQFSITKPAEKPAENMEELLGIIGAISYPKKSEEK